MVHCFGLKFPSQTKLTKTKGEYMNMNETIFVALGIAAFVVVFATVAKVRHILIVTEGFAGLLYRNGKFVEILQAGRHVRWGRAVAMTLQDLRKTTVQVAGQEVLTADNVSVKFSLMLTYQIVEAAKAAHETQSWYADVYNAAQLALRAVISGIAVEALLNQRNAIDAQLLPIVQAAVAKIGVNVLAVEVKDVILPADLKRAFAETLKAKQEGQAALERARGETAALRNLANAARVLEDNPALMNLRIVQSITAAQGAGHTLVFGMPAGFVPLKNGANGKAEDRNET
jgi:regulator of protease activity HflC (stomatin/prohibitin superfamily)